MPSHTAKHRWSSPDLTFTVGGVSEKHLADLDQAMLRAAKMSMDTGGKNVGIYIFAHTPEGARKWGGEEGLQMFDNTPLGEAFAVIHVKVNPPGYFAG